jgi:hypothetical protein
MPCMPPDRGRSGLRPLGEHQAVPEIQGCPRLLWIIARWRSPRAADRSRINAQFVIDSYRRLLGTGTALAGLAPLT